MDHVDREDLTGDRVEVIQTDGQVVGVVDLIDPEDRLSPRQRSFIDQYFLHNMNATKAAIAAGYTDGPGIRVQAHRLLHHEGVQAAIRMRLEAEHMSATELLRTIARDARGLFGEYIDPNGGEIDLARMQEDGTLHLIEAIVPTKYGTSYKGPSRQRAQEMLIKILGLAKTHQTVSGEVTVTHSLDERLEQLSDLIRGAGGRKGASQQDGA